MSARLIDRHLPEYDFVERHQIDIDASAGTVYDAIHRADLAGHIIIRMLFALRGLPSLFRRGEREKRDMKLTLATITRNGFRLLADDGQHEIVLGIAGKFWTPTGGLEEFEAEEFRAMQRGDIAKAAWNFEVVPDGAKTILRTETRIKCTTPAAHRSFRRYWRFIAPFSGLTRILMLRAIRAEAVKPA